MLIFFGATRDSKLTRYRMLRLPGNDTTHRPDRLFTFTDIFPNRRATKPTRQRLAADYRDIYDRRGNYFPPAPSVYGWSKSVMSQNVVDRSLLYLEVINTPCQVCGNMSRYILGRIVSPAFRSGIRSYKIVGTLDGTTLVAWHPKRDFPYECTRPLPEEKTDEHPSVLKTQLTPELMSIFNKKTPEQARQELMNLTATTKHRWFPRARDKKAKKTPMNREYL
ncbi:uncharacterized protein LOC132707438 [Cylas formicarius]|uniref:uncharacterized protein LOC132707438 n=1 Tax=Cylas formicarius TaxID=197179 RepID=UPI0029584A40|nr:uncharacterized protein LOC132707438 [Cylas formicarius]